MQRNLDLQLEQKLEQLEQKNKIHLSKEKAKLVEQNALFLEREKQLLEKYFQTEKEALVKTHGSELLSVKTFLNKEMNMKLGLKEKEVIHLKRSLAKKKEEVQTLRSENKSLGAEYKKTCELEVEKVRNQLETENCEILRNEQQKLEVSFQERVREFESRFERENQEKIEMLIHKFSQESLEKDAKIEGLQKRNNRLDLKLAELDRDLDQAVNDKEVEMLKGEVTKLRGQLTEARERRLQLELENSGVTQENQTLNETIAK